MDIFVKTIEEEDPKIWGDKVLEKLFECVSMSQERVDAANKLSMDLQGVLQERWPECKVIRFGSTLVGVALSTSDVDCFVQLPSKPTTTSLFKARDLLAAHPELFDKINPLPNAPSPIIQYVHLPSGHRGDMGFFNPELVNGAYLLRYLLHLDKRALRLAVIIKYWAFINSSPESSPIFTNYNLVMLLIFYLQQKDILPSIALLQENLDEHVIIDNWEVGFNEISYFTTNRDTLFELLSGFFKFYADLDFENNIISMYSGTMIKRRVFEQLETVPDLFQNYKQNVARNITTPLNIKTPVCIQNFFIHSFNAGHDTTDELLDRFRSYLKYASKIIVDQDYLSLKHVFNGSKFL